MKNLRLIAALSLAFAPLFLASPAHASPTVIVTPGGDDSSYQIPLTQPVFFFGEQYSTIYATTNAVITFGSPDGTYWDFPMTPSISLGSTDWVVYPHVRSDEHFIISYTDNSFQVDMSARPIWLQNTPSPSRLILTGIINEDRTINFSYYLENTSEYDLRFGVRTSTGEVLSLDDGGFTQAPSAPEEPGQIAPEEPATESESVSPEVSESSTVSSESEPVSESYPAYSMQGFGTEGARQWVRLTAPEGTVFTEVLFASYGLPVQEGDLWMINQSCHASSSAALVESLALGQSFIEINITNDFFGEDPCGGTQKSFAVVLAYGAVSDSSSETTESPTVSPEPAPESSDNVSESPTVSPSPESSPSESPVTESPVSEPPTTSPEPEVTPTPTPTPSPTPSPEPVPAPVVPSPEPPPSIPEPVQPAPVPQPEPEPTPEPSPEPTPEPVQPETTPEPTPAPTPIAEPTPAPSPEPVVTPKPEPSVTPTPTPVPTPSPSLPEPSPTPTPTPTPSPEPTPTPVLEPAPTTPIEVTLDTPIADVVSVIQNVVPTSLTEEQAAVLVSVALATFETAEQGSEEYEQALDLLLIAAQQDDVVLDEAIAAIPLVGNIAGAAVDAFNALGNAGADMSPKVREDSEKVVIAAVIVANIAITATSAASAAAAAARRP